ncbi:MAG: carboxypeptidase-like regulatory domain-containing protein [Pyrinomonadaceae bacterium]
MSGTLLDQTGAIFPFTTVHIKNEKGKIIQTKSDGEGKFTVELPYGVFIISAESEVNSALYKSKEIKIEIKNSDRKRLDLTLFCTEGDKGKCPIVETSYCG